MPKKILLADDSITIQKVISITFAAESYDLTIVGDGDSAVKKAREIGPDLIMADVAMPGKTGYEVCEAVKKDPALKSTPVLLLAGTFEPLNKDEALKAGADDSIVKPFESQELLDKVKELLDKAEAKTKTVPGPAAQAAPERKPKAEQASDDIWQSGDFLGFTEEPEKAEFKPEEVPDLDFLDSSFFEEPEKPRKQAAPDLSIPREKDFFDLEFKEEDIKSAAPSKEAKKDDFFGGDFDFSADSRTEAKPEPFEFGPVDFDPFKAEPKKEEPRADFETLSPFESAPAEPLAAQESKPFWAEDLRREEEKAAFDEPELIEGAEPIVEETPSPGRFFEPPQEEPKFEVPKFESPRFEETVFETPRIEPVAPLRDKPVVEDRPQRAEAIAAQAVSAAPIRGEALRESAPARIEERIREAAVPRIEGLPITKEEAEAIVRKVARDVIEEVAWEVIPDLAEELIKAEIAKAKEAIFKTK